ncbi:MAG TPA: hypothetical protein VNO70_24580, partial [Blastocatellia bacterium]|nr:hypothetical protein [Blastocatellia bacterium]
MDVIRLDLDRTEPDAPSEGEVRFQAAALAGIAATAASLIARFVFDAPLVPELLAHFIFAVVPIWMVEIAVGVLGPFAKHLAFLGCVVLYFLALLAAALLFLRYRATLGRAKALSSLALALILWAVTLTVVIPLLGGGLSGQYLRQGALYSAVLLFVVHLVYAAAIIIFSRLYLDGPAAT